MFFFEEGLTLLAEAAVGEDVVMSGLKSSDSTGDSGFEEMWEADRFIAGCVVVLGRSMKSKK